MMDDEIAELRKLAPMPEPQFIKLVAFIEGIERDYSVTAQHHIRTIALLRGRIGALQSLIELDPRP